MINQFQKKNYVNSPIVILFLIAFIFFSIKWGYSFYHFNEEIISKVIFESVADGSFFYPLIKYLSLGEFKISLNSLNENLKTIAFPFGSIILHSIFFKIFNIYGLIIVDFFGIFFFLIIFYKIFQFFNTSGVSILLSLIFFSIPIILNFFLKDYNFIPLNQFKEFYTLRVHRPFPANLYMFLFIYLIILMNTNQIFQRRYFLSLGAIMALTFSSFYYFFIIQIVSIIFFLFLKFRNKILDLMHKNLDCILFFIISFLIFSSPFIYMLVFHENDLTIASGVFDLNLEKKIFLLKYFLIKIFNLQFFLINIFIFTLAIIINKKEFKNRQILNIFIIIYLSSIIAPFLFIILSSKSGILYHFNNNIIIFGCLSLLISSILLSKKILDLFHQKKLTWLFLIFLIFISIKKELDKKEYIDPLRIEFNKITKIINKKKMSKDFDTLLTFDNRFMIWTVLSNKIQYLNLTYVGLTSKNFNMIENDLINSFYFLGLDSDDFLKFLENKKQNWRYFNPNVANFFSLRYTANSLNTYKSSKNFEPNIKDFILDTSPIYSQQIAIPEEEYERLERKFMKRSNNQSLNPSLIILDKNLPFYEKIDLNLDDYCEIFSGQIYELYFLKDQNLVCKN
tara:strand:+ start:101 stop:1966 length:1866 start_codon:yes stop_codon:yes gene_type:complete